MHSREGGKCLSEAGLKILGRAWGRTLVYVSRPLPLMGVIAFGVIDRGTNVLQVRPTTLCVLNCIFCSVDAGPKSRSRASEYIVEPEWLAEWVEEVAKEKNVLVEALIDGVGEPMTYPWLPKLVRMLKRSPWVKTVAVETHGFPLTIRMVHQLEEAGLDRINLSLDTLNPEKARMLTGFELYDVKRVVEVAEYIVKETSIDLHVTPLWLPGVNDEDVVEVIEWALRIGAGKRWPPVTVQKFVAHKRGRKPPGVKEVSWSSFWKWLEKLESRVGVRLRPSMAEWGMHYAPRVRQPYKRGDTVKVQIVGPGWLRGELLAVTLKRDRLITLVKAREFEVGDVVTAKITWAKDNIFVAEPA